MSFDQAKVEEVKAKFEERENFIRESWVKAMEARIVLEQLNICHQAEGVNHYESCRWLSEKYLDMLKDSRVKGYKKIDI